MFHVELRRPNDRCWRCVVEILSVSFPEAVPHVVVAIASAAALVQPVVAWPAREGDVHGEGALPCWGGFVEPGGDGE